jgi:hypothetical protein
MSAQEPVGPVVDAMPEPRPACDRLDPAVARVDAQIVA